MQLPAVACAFTAAKFNSALPLPASKADPLPKLQEPRDPALVRHRRVLRRV